MRFRKFGWIILAVLLFSVAVTVAANYWVKGSTRQQIYTDISTVPHNRVGLLLGCTKFLKKGWPNFYYSYRIQSAVALFKAGKVDYILVSGDNGTKYYDETTAMKDDLLAAGIPADRIVCDYAGFRTLDSILRCRDVFGETDITIISQQFHDERALFIANHKGLHAIAFAAEDIGGANGFKTQVREKLARVKMMLDLLFNKKAKFYGPKVTIG